MRGAVPRPAGQASLFGPLSDTGEPGAPGAGCGRDHRAVGTARRRAARTRDVAEPRRRILLPQPYPIGYNNLVTWNAETLKRLRARRGLTQEALAQRAGTTRVTIARLETGTRRPSVDLLLRLAKALKTPVADLLK